MSCQEMSIFFCSSFLIFSATFMIFSVFLDILSFDLGFQIKSIHLLMSFLLLFRFFYLLSFSLFNVVLNSSPPSFFFHLTYHKSLLLIFPYGPFAFVKLLIFSSFQFHFNFSDFCHCLYYVFIY